MAIPKFNYGVLTYYPTIEAWIINFNSTNPEYSLERKATASADGIRAEVFQVLNELGKQGWDVFQVDGYIERDYPVYHLRRVCD